MAPDLLFDRYEILELISSGRFSEVHRAYDTRMERDVAIKKIRRDSEPTPRAIREARTVALLNHPNIVTLYELEEDKDFFYLIMEYIDGLKLSDLLLAGEALEFNAALSIVIQVCYALENAHLNQIIHRDIKPQNLMILPDGRVKVMDFGLAQLSAQQDKSQDFKISGTPAYMSPEQAKGNYLDESTDIYSLGAVLYRLTTGSLPFEGKTIKSVILKIQNSEPLSPRKINLDIPENLVNVMMKAMEKNPDERFQTATDFRYKLERCLSDSRVPQIITADLYAEISETYDDSDKGLNLDFGLNIPSFHSLSDKNLELSGRFISSTVIGITLYITWTAALDSRSVALVLLPVIIALINLALPLIGVGLMWLFMAIAAFQVSPGLGIFLIFFLAAYYIGYGRHHPGRSLWPVIVYPLAGLKIIFLFPLIIGQTGGWISSLVLSTVGFFFWEALLILGTRSGFFELIGWQTDQFAISISSTLNPFLLPFNLIKALFTNPVLFLYLLLFIATALVSNLFSHGKEKPNIILGWFAGSAILVAGNILISQLFETVVFSDMMKYLSMALVVGLVFFILFPYTAKDNNKRDLEDTNEYIGNEFIS